MFCRQCLYPLDGLPENRCPECGLPFSPADPATYLDKPRYPACWQCTCAMLLAVAAWLLGLALFFDSFHNHQAISDYFLFAFWAGSTVLAVIFAVAGITRRRTLRKRRGWIALAVVAVPFCLLGQFVWEDCPNLLRPELIGLLELFFAACLIILAVVFYIAGSNRARTVRRRPGCIALAVASILFAGLLLLLHHVVILWHRY
jgi:hypothetical protein